MEIGKLNPNQYYLYEDRQGNLQSMRKGGFFDSLSRWFIRNFVAKTTDLAAMSRKGGVLHGKLSDLALRGASTEPICADLQKFQDSHKSIGLIFTACLELNKPKEAQSNQALSDHRKQKSSNSEAREAANPSGREEASGAKRESHQSYLNSLQTIYSREAVRAAWELIPNGKRNALREGRAAWTSSMCDQFEAAVKKEQSELNKAQTESVTSGQSKLCRRALAKLFTPTQIEQIERGEYCFTKNDADNLRNEIQKIQSKRSAKSALERQRASLALEPSLVVKGHQEVVRQFLSGGLTSSLKGEYASELLLEKIGLGLNRAQRTAFEATVRRDLERWAKQPLPTRVQRELEKIKSGDMEKEIESLIVRERIAAVGREFSIERVANLVKWSRELAATAKKNLPGESDLVHELVDEVLSGNRELIGRYLTEGSPSSGAVESALKADLKNLGLAVKSLNREASEWQKVHKSSQVWSANQSAEENSVLGSGICFAVASDATIFLTKQPKASASELRSHLSGGGESIFTERHRAAQADYAIQVRMGGSSALRVSEKRLVAAGVEQQVKSLQAKQSDGLAITRELYNSAREGALGEGAFVLTMQGDGGNHAITVQIDSKNRVYRFLEVNDGVGLHEFSSMKEFAGAFSSYLEVFHGDKERFAATYFVPVS